MIGEKIAKIMEEVVPIVKTEAGVDNNYKIPKPEEIIKMVEPLLVKNKVGIIPNGVKDFIPQGNRVYLTMKYLLIDLEGKDEEKDYIEIEMPGSGYDEKSGRAVFSALTGIYNYIMRQVFAIPIIDEIHINSSEKEIVNKENDENRSIEENSEEYTEIQAIDTEDLDSLFSLQDLKGA